MEVSGEEAKVDLPGTGLACFPAMDTTEQLAKQHPEQRAEPAGYLPISDYGVVGDSRSAALISSGGSIDWLCWPNFDGPSVFARLLDSDRGGYFALRPTEAFRSEQRYLGDTNVLETTFRTASGAVKVTDLMPALPEEMKRRRLMPLRSLIRRVEGVEGRAEMELLFSPRPDYGRAAPALESRGSGSVVCQWGSWLLHLRSDLPLAAQASDSRCKFAIGRGERHYFSLAYSEDAPAVYPSIGEAAEEELEATLGFWRDWAAKCSYSGPYREAVMRSALALKLLAFAPSGAVVAAPTTSLPERVGGDLNWDYRYCWLRDASFIVGALYDLGYREEGSAFANWMMHATRLTHPALQVLYTVYGESRVSEGELAHLEGYRGSGPVRIGNGAYDQLQMDVYGEVMPALERYFEETGHLDSDTRRLVAGMADLLARRWGEPDHGIWETRGEKRHYVHGKAMAWRAMDCAARLSRRAGVRGDPGRLDRAREELRSVVLARGFNPRLGTFVRTLDGDELDGALLALPLIGLIPGDDPRMAATIDAIRRELGAGELIYRTRQSRAAGDPSHEGAFLTCSFWLVSALALAGRVEEAHRVFQGLLARSNGLGLYSEEMDPEGVYLGNYPLGLTHIALVTAALDLERADAGPARLSHFQGTKSPR